MRAANGCTFERHASRAGAAIRSWADPAPARTPVRRAALPDATSLPVRRCSAQRRPSYKPSARCWPGSDPPVSWPHGCRRRVRADFSRCRLFQIGFARRSGTAPVWFRHVSMLDPDHAEVCRPLLHRGRSRAIAVRLALRSNHRGTNMAVHVRCNWLGRGVREAGLVFPEHGCDDPSRTRSRGFPAGARWTGGLCRSAIVIDGQLVTTTSRPVIS